MAELAIQLTSGENRLLHLLLGRNEPTTVAELARLTGMSRRTVYYSLSNLRLLLRRLQAGELGQGSDGFLLTDIQRSAVLSHLAKENTQLGRKDRLSYIICAAICATVPLRVSDLQNRLDVSRNIVFADLNDVKKELATYQLELKSSKAKGYFVKGDLLLMRTVFQLHIASLIRSVGRRQIDFFAEDIVEGYLERMRILADKISLNISEDSLLELVYLLLMIRALPSGEPVQVIDADIIQKTVEFEAVNQIFAELLEYERGYLAICLMNFSSGSTYANMWSKELELWECAARLIDRFELIACVYFENKDELLHAVYMHMKLSCYNYRNAVAHINPLRSEIQSKYAELFSMTKLCCERMAEDFPYPVNDDEVAYLATHFGVAMRSAVHEAELAYVLLACPSMTTSVQLLRAEIQTKFDNIIIEDVVRASEIDEYSARRQIDFVISTVACKCRYPVIKVNPILTDEDRANIITLMTLLDIGTSLDSTQLKILLRIVRRNVDHTTYQRIREEINHYLNTEGSLVSVPESASARLYDALQMYGLRLVSEGSSDWESAVQETALPLLKKGCIEPRYAEKLIELGRAHGPYFVIGEDIAIAHARPQDGVKRLGLCLSIYPQGLTIMSRSIRLLFVLASPNQQEHFRILQNIMSLNKNSSMLDALCSVQTEEQALALFASFQQNFDMLGVQL